MTVTVAAPRLLLVEAHEGTPGQQVQSRRKALGMSAAELARQARVHRNTVTAIEKDDGGRDKLAAVQATLGRLEEEVGMDTPDIVTNRITLPDGTQVVFAGSADGVAEAAARFLSQRGQ